MDRPRLIYYNDGHHFHAKRLEPPASLHMLQWPVDEIAGTGVDTLVLGLGYSDVYFHRSKVGRVVGQGKQTWDSYIDWRILRMVEAGHSLGTDQLRVCIERGRQSGVRVIPSLKLQDTSPPGDERCGWLKQERRAEVCIGEEGRYLFGYDWMHAEVAEAKLAVVREVLDDYGADGIELDFMFDLRFFKSGEAETGAALMTGFVAQVRELARAAATRRGTDVPVMVRVAISEARNEEAGLQTGQWVQQGLVDWVVGQDDDLLMDTEAKPGWLPQGVADHGGAAYYRPPRRVYHEATASGHIEMYRALQQTLALQGWSGLYDGYLPWPFGDAEHDLLREMAFPEVTARRDKRYFLQPREGGAVTTTPQRVLPVRLCEGEAARVSIHVADDVDAARADGEMRRPVLTLQFHSFCNQDALRVRFNGRDLSIDDAEVTDERALFYPLRLAPDQVQAPPAGAFHWFRFHLGVEDVRRGENVVEVVLDRLEPRATFARALNGVELHMRYRDMQRPLGIEPDRVAPPGG
jgi:hypothetical protein